ncbi:MAG: hypothetical protein VYA69_09540 [Gemmatimonadota bacterium]|nr:hypothetical protein [Gemmatimonadota bacterium]
MHLVDHPGMLPFVVDAIGWNIPTKNPVLRQLLGALPSGDDPMGAAPEFHPMSQYWLTENTYDLPLKGWAEERIQKKEAHGQI